MASPDTREAFDERAAIREFDGGQGRAKAERLAWCEVACRHYRRRPPDGVAACAGGRDDLQALYAEGNPLRRIPADLGASCSLFEWEPGANYYGPQVDEETLLSEQACNQEVLADTC